VSQCAQLTWSINVITVPVGSLLVLPLTQTHGPTFRQCRSQGGGMG